MMGFIQRNPTVHAYMQLDSILTSDSPCTEMMGLAYSGKRQYRLFDLLLDLIRQRLFQQFIHTGDEQLYSHLYNENTDHYCRYRIKDSPFVSQQYGSTDTDSRTYGREGITPVMPSIGHYCLRIEFTPFDGSVLIQNLFQYNRNQSCHQRQHTRCFKLLAMENTVNGGSPVPKNSNSHA